MAYYGYGNEDDLRDDPALSPYLEEDKKKRKTQKYLWEEDQTLKEYIAATPKGQRRFTNIPGSGEDTFFMPEAPLQAPLGVSNEMRDRAPYNVDPGQITQERVEALQAEGKPADPEQIYMGVVDELNRRDEINQQQLGMERAMLLKHGVPKQSENNYLISLIKNADVLINVYGKEGFQLMLDEARGVEGAPQIELPDEEEMARAEEERKESEAGWKRVVSSVRKKEKKEKDLTRTKKFMSKGRGKKPRGYGRGRSQWPFGGKFFMPTFDEDDYLADFYK